MLWGAVQTGDSATLGLISGNKAGMLVNAHSTLLAADVCTALGARLLSAVQLKQACPLFQAGGCCRVRLLSKALLVSALTAAAVQHCTCRTPAGNCQQQQQAAFMPYNSHCLCSSIQLVLWAALQQSLHDNQYMPPNKLQKFLFSLTACLIRLKRSPQAVLSLVTCGFYRSHHCLMSDGSLFVQEAMQHCLAP